jgi:predicted ATP-grasp superfamily ATP-dependent carboligase
MSEPRSLLALGYSVRHIVASGCRAGYEMYAADAFGDMDTRRYARAYIPLDPLQLHAGLSTLAAWFHLVDGVIIGSGFETADFSVLDELAREKIVGNAPEKMREIANKAWLAARLGDLGIPHPRTLSGEELIARLDRLEQVRFRYPVVAKPAYGGGGTANFYCRTEQELARWARKLPDFLFQDYIEGHHASVSVLLTKHAARSVSVNEQLLGLRALGAPGPFVYCGNISPFLTKFEDRLRELAEEVTHILGLVGSNGVDFVIAEDGPVVIEVNPRLQGSLDTVELSTGLNLVDGHVKAVTGELPEQLAANRYAAKAIVFAERAGVVKTNLESAAGGIVDIPAKGRSLRPGEPIATAVGVGATRARACAEAMENVARIKASVQYKEGC